ncbi:MAG TPA: hypothetical protein VF274_00985 [Alphaproteobacteria bacterium]
MTGGRTQARADMSEQFRRRGKYIDMPPIAIGGSIGGGPVVPIVDGAGVPTALWPAELFATMFYPCDPAARRTFVARAIASWNVTEGLGTSAAVLRALLEPGALGALDAATGRRWLMGLHAGGALRWVWRLAVAAPRTASLRNAWQRMADDQRPAASWQTYRNAWNEMKTVAHFWAAVDQRVTTSRGRTDGPLLCRFPDVGYTGEVDLMRLVEEAEIYRAFLEGRFRPHGYAPRKELIDDMSSVWRVPASWRPVARDPDWPPTGRALIEDIGSAGAG